MLGSQEEDSSPQDNDNSRHYHHHHHGHRIIQTFSNTPPSIHMRQLLSSCAELISRSDLSAAHRLTTILSTNSSQFGDSTERLVHQFTKALSLRLHRLAATITTTTTMATAAATTAFFLPKSPTTTRPISNYFTPSSSSNIPLSIYNQSEEYDDSAIQSSYLSLNQITPFIRFTHLTANQAILEAIDNHNTIHILDFDIMHGVQWPPLMQALAERYPPPSLQISGTGNNIDVLQRTGDRLEKFAHSLNLKFQFHPIFLPNTNNSISSLTTFHLNLPPNESLAINCMSYLHRFNNQNLMIFLHKIRSMNPKVVTISEPEADHDHPLFLQRFGGCVEYYTAVFDSLEATLPPNSRERLSVEQVWFGREISDIVAAEGENRRERHQRFRAWDLMLRTSGFVNVPLSPFALSQAKLLLRLHYPSEGYQIEAINDSFFLGWQNQHLFSVSSWH